MKESISIEGFKKRFDTSLIEPDATDKEVVSFIEKCKKYAQCFAAVAFNVHQIPLAVEQLRGTGIEVCVPIAYPLGGLPVELAVSQVEYAMECGARQIDVCMPLDALRAGEYDFVQKYIETIVKATRGTMKNISFIPNIAYLSVEEKKLAARLIRDGGGTIIKTNTGFGLVTKVEEVRLLKEEVGSAVEIMASGGIRNVEEALEMFGAGADKIATSTPFEVFEGLDRVLWLQ